MMTIACLILIDDSLTHFRADKGLIKLTHSACDDNIINIKSSNVMAYFWMKWQKFEWIRIQGKLYISYYSIDN